MIYSRLFWIYCAALSLLFVVMGIGLLTGGSLYTTVGSRRYGQLVGLLPLAIGAGLFVYCIFKAAAAKARP